MVLSLAQLVLVGIGVFYWVHALSFVVFWGFVALMAAYYYQLRNFQ